VHVAAEFAPSAIAFRGIDFSSIGPIAPRAAAPLTGVRPGCFLFPIGAHRQTEKIPNRGYALVADRASRPAVAVAISALILDSNSFKLDFRRPHEVPADARGDGRPSPRPAPVVATSTTTPVRARPSQPYALAQAAGFL
jgi:hypothetical protein